MIVASSTLNRLYSSSVSRNVLELSAIVTESTRMCFTSESSAYYSIGNGPVPSSASRHDGVVTIRHHRESRQRPTGILPEFYSEVIAFSGINHRKSSKYASFNSTSAPWFFFFPEARSSTTNPCRSVSSSSLSSESSAEATFHVYWGAMYQ